MHYRHEQPVGEDVEQGGRQRHQRHETDLAFAAQSVEMQRQEEADRRTGDHRAHEQHGAIGHGSIAGGTGIDDLPADSPVDQIEDEGNGERQRMRAGKHPTRALTIAGAEPAGEDARHAVRDKRLQGDQQHQSGENQADGRERVRADIGAEEIGVDDGEQAVDGGDRDDRCRRPDEDARQPAGEKGIALGKIGHGEIRAI